MAKAFAPFRKRGLAAAADCVCDAGDCDAGACDAGDCDAGDCDAGDCDADAAEVL